VNEFVTASNYNKLLDYKPAIKVSNYQKLYLISITTQLKQEKLEEK
jgi:hypothetical protein